MKKSLLLAFLILAATTVMLPRTGTGPAEQAPPKGKAADGQPARLVNQERIAEVIVDNRAGQAAVDRKKAADRESNLNLQVEKIMREDSNLRPTASSTPPPKSEAGKPGEEFGSILPDGMPLWFRTLDKDEDGQIGLYEWRESGKSIEEFRKYDINGDGFITVDEMRRHIKRWIELKLEKGQVKYSGVIETSDEIHKGSKLSKVFTIELHKGESYQIDHASKAFDAYLYLEDPDGKVLAENDDGGEGTDSRIVHTAERTGTYRIIATSLGGTRPGAFALSVRTVEVRGAAPKGLPNWFQDLDKDGDGQVSMYEWKESGRPLDEFLKYDFDGDGLITRQELQRGMKMLVDLKLADGRAEYRGAVVETINERYQGKKTFKIFSVKFEVGRSYQIEQISEEFPAFLFLENSNGKILAKNNSGGNGKTARIVYHAASSGIFRIIATSQDGVKAGDFSLSIRVIDSFGGVMAKDLPAWFKDLDKNKDGQIALSEWRDGGLTLEEFRKFDQNGDGFITAAEALRFLKKPVELRFQKNQATAKGAIDATDEKYLEKRLSKAYTISFEKGKTYQIDLMSKDFGAYLYLEDLDGNILDKIHSGGKGMTARILYHPESAETCRIVATSQEGNKTGAFTLSVRVNGK